MQAIFLALVRAVDHYDPDKEFLFSTYWGNCVKNEFNALLGMRTSKRDPLNNCTSLDAPLSNDTDAEKEIKWYDSQLAALDQERKKAAVPVQMCTRYAQQ